MRPKSPSRISIYAQMHLAHQAWREHRGLPHMRELLTNWLPKGDSPDRRGWEWFYLNSLLYQNVRSLAPGVRRDITDPAAWHGTSPASDLPPAPTTA